MEQYCLPFEDLPNQEYLNPGVFIIPPYRKMNFIQTRIGPSGSFDVAPIMLGNAAMNLAAILISLL